MTDPISKRLRRYMMKGTTCTSQEATDFFANVGLFFHDEAQGDYETFESALFMGLFDIFSKAAVASDDEI